jgi:hypothetical protein
MRKLKYIVDELNGFAIFSNYINHDDVGRLMERRGAPPVGAGFIEIFDGKVHCYGKSESLRISSRGSIDDSVISTHLDLDPME